MKKVGGRDESVTMVAALAAQHGAHPRALVIRLRHRLWADNLPTNAYSDTDYVLAVVVAIAVLPPSADPGLPRPPPHFHPCQWINVAGSRRRVAAGCFVHFNALSLSLTASKAKEVISKISTSLHYLNILQFPYIRQLHVFHYISIFYAEHVWFPEILGWLSDCGF